ncbi:MAG: class I SAM-dependent methyltransferase [Gammaproteobacteria bacterium]|nr:class I SAM-dependent methyltransferase [Gammaproteobacteria bacterium]
MMKINAKSSTLEGEAQLLQIVDHWGLSISSDASFELHWDGDKLSISSREFPTVGAHFVDFVGGAVAHRRRFGGGRGQMIARAVGLKSGINPVVVDATAGWGRDAFLLTSLGCTVTMIERSPIVGALLEDGLRRAQADSEIGQMVTERLKLISADALDWLGSTEFEPDVIYIDPMFPHRTKTAQVKKESFYLQQLLGPATDGDELLVASTRVAKKRVVVKRPKQAPVLAERKPTHSYTTKSHRFDAYIR